MPATYDRLGLRFLYPENWQIADEQASQWPRSVMLQSPKTAFWSVDVYPGEGAADCAKDALANMQKEYELEHRAESETIAGYELQGYDLDFYCLDFLVRALIRAFSIRGQTFLILAQAEDREFGQMLPVFTAITTSLAENLREAADLLPSGD